MPTWSQRVKLLFLFLIFWKKNLWSQKKKKKDQTKPTAHNSTCFSTPVAVVQVFTSNKNPWHHNSGTDQLRGSSSVVKRRSFIVFSNELPRSAEGAGYHLSCTTPMYMVEVWGHFVWTVPPAGGRASFIGRQRLGCNQGVHHLVCTLAAGLPLGRREKLRSEAREWRTQKRKQKKWTWTRLGEEARARRSHGRERESGRGRRALRSCRAAGCPASACPGIPRQP